MKAAGEFERVGDFMKLIVERNVTVSSWRTLTFSSNLEMPWFLFLRLVSRELTPESFFLFIFQIIILGFDGGFGVFIKFCIEKYLKII